jgi:hypothetical protein
MMLAIPAAASWQIALSARGERRRCWNETNEEQQQDADNAPHDGSFPWLIRR